MHSYANRTCLHTSNIHSCVFIDMLIQTRDLVKVIQQYLNLYTYTYSLCGPNEKQRLSSSHRLHFYLHSLHNFNRIAITERVQSVGSCNYNRNAFIYKYINTCNTLWSIHLIIPNILYVSKVPLTSCAITTLRRVNK